MIGSFAIHNNLNDVAVMLGLGVVGWLLKPRGLRAPRPSCWAWCWARSPSRGFVQSYLIGNAQGDVLAMFFARPISLAIVAFSALTLLYPLVAARLGARRARRSHADLTVEGRDADR